MGKSYIQCIKDSWHAFYDSAPRWDWPDLGEALNTLAAIFLIVLFTLLSPLLVLIGGAIRYCRQFKLGPGSANPYLSKGGNRLAVIRWGQISFQRYLASAARVVDEGSLPPRLSQFRFV
jgi:hypothetical protein